MSKTSKIFVRILVLLAPFFGVFSAYATDSNNQGNINSQAVKEDYRAFLQQLKQLNSQYKQITGEITKVMKEEGVPSWQTGDETKQLGELFPPEPTVLSPELGVTIKDSATEMAVSMDLPGIKKDTIKITIKDGNKLTVFAQKKDDTAVKTIEKTISLPALANPEGAKAAYEDGVLTLKIKKIGSKEVIIPVK
jgi:HSP20 family molecular chaperone IbpA